MELSIKGPSLRPRALGTQGLYSKVRITNGKLRVTLTLKSIHKIALIAHVFVTFDAFIGSVNDNFVRNVCTNRFKITTFRFTVLHGFYSIGQYCFAAVPLFCPFKSVFCPVLQALCCLCRSISLRHHKSFHNCSMFYILDSRLLILFNIPVHPGLDINVGEFLDNIQLKNLKDIFEQEEVSLSLYFWEMDLKCRKDKRNYCLVYV